MSKIVHEPSTCNCPLPQKHYRYDNNIIMIVFKLLLVTCTSLTVCLLYLYLTHGRQTFKFALKNKLHQLQCTCDTFFITCSCDVMTQNPSTCNLSCDAYSSSYCLHKLSINRYCMDNILYFSDHNQSFKNSLVYNLS